MKNGGVMQNNRSVLAVYMPLLIFLVLFFSRAHGEVLFRWTDDAGRTCYSNVSPPAGVKVFSVDTVFQPVQPIPVRPNTVQASAGAETAEKIPVETGDTYPDFSAECLKQRIADRKRSIGRIEALLRKHPNDAVLRKSLFKKKQYLFEDLNRLKNGRL